MASNHTIRFRVTKTELDRIKYISIVKGYKSTSSYLRSLALKGDSFVEKKLVEVSKDVKEILAKLTK